MSTDPFDIFYQKAREVFYNKLNELEPNAKDVYHEDFISDALDASIEEMSKVLIPKSPENAVWKLKSHSYQIADTGDWGGYHEITNGKESLLITNDDYDESLQVIVDALNASGCQFHVDDTLQYENELYKEEVRELYKTIEQLRNDKARLLEALKETDTKMDAADVWVGSSSLTMAINIQIKSNKKLLSEMTRA